MRVPGNAIWTRQRPINLSRLNLEEIFALVPIGHQSFQNPEEVVLISTATKSPGSHKVINSRGGRIFYQCGCSVITVAGDASCTPSMCLLLSPQQNLYHNVTMSFTLFTGHWALSTQGPTPPSRFYNNASGGQVWQQMSGDSFKVAENVPSQRFPPSILRKHLPLPIPSRPWSHLGVDFVTDLPPSSGNTCILVVIEHFSKSCCLNPFKSLPTAMETAELLFQHVFPRMCYRAGVCNSSPECGKMTFINSKYHPQSNGQIMQKIEEVGREWVSRRPGASTLVELNTPRTPSVNPVCSGTSTIIVPLVGRTI